jgi:para-nitrobenzyl esterase
VLLSACDGDDPGVERTPSPADPLVVATESEQVRGERRDGARLFLGIPYAAPPVGERRWRPPAPPEPWSGAREATALGPECPGTLPVLNAPVGDDENCLSLNVVTPDPAPVGAPVMVWIHGGGFISRDGLFARVTRGDRLAAAGAVVVVSFNYRLGPLGFLAHPALTAEDPGHPSSGNYGIEDQVAALEWVQRNIAAFGGDPGDVTIFGQSAGGWSVCVHLASPRSSGLFHRAIVQSGVCTLPLPTLDVAAEQGERLAESLGCAAGTAADEVACLRAASPRALREALAPNPSVFLTEGDWALWRPVVDGVVLTEQVAAAFAAGRANRVPLLAGANRDEGTFFVLAAHEYRGEPLSPALYPDRLRIAFGETFGGEIARQYPLASFASPAAALAEALGDGILACPTIEAVRLLAPWMPAYLYELDHRDLPYALGEPVLLDLDPGAFHGAEIPLVFGVPEMGEFDGATALLSEDVLGAWARFAATGDPNGGRLPPWPRFDPAAREYLAFDSASAVRRGARLDACDFWRSLDRSEMPLR